MSLIPSKRQHHFRPLCHLYLFILVFIYLSHPACGAAWRMPPALHAGGNGPPGTGPPIPGVLAQPRIRNVSLWPRTALSGQWDGANLENVGSGPISVRILDASRDRSALFPKTGGHWQNSMVPFGSIYSWGLIWGYHVKGHALPLSTFLFSIRA